MLGLEDDDDAKEDAFLINEGLDLLTSFRMIKSKEARKAIIVMIAAVAQAERDAEEKEAT